MLKVSVIIPVYNVEKYIKQCLDNLLCQTLQDFEIICINDGSTDTTPSILKQYALKDDRIIVISQENQGPGIARNKGLEIANGEYIAFVDPDDWLEVRALEKLYNFAKSQNAKVVQFNYREFNDFSGKFKNINFAKKVKRLYGYNLGKKNYFNINILKEKCFLELGWHAWERFYQREFIKKINALFSPTKNGEDQLFANIVVLNAPKIYYLSDFLYNYRCRGGSAVNTISNDNFGVFENIKLFEEYLKNNNFFEDFEKEFNKYKIAELVEHYSKIPPENIEKYNKLTREILTETLFAEFIKYKNNKLKIIEKIFSVRNKKTNGIKTKIITILGFSFEIDPNKK